MKRKAEPTTEELFRDGRRIDRAMRRAVREALHRHKRAGVAIAVWRSGKVVRIAPSQIKVGRDGEEAGVGDGLLGRGGGRRNRVVGRQAPGGCVLFHGEGARPY